MQKLLKLPQMRPQNPLQKSRKIPKHKTEGKTLRFFFAKLKLFYQAPVMLSGSTPCL